MGGRFRCVCWCIAGTNAREKTFRYRYRHLTVLASIWYTSTMKTTTTRTPADTRAHGRGTRRPESGTKAAVLKCAGLLRPMSAALSAAYREMLSHRRTVTLPECQKIRNPKLEIRNKRRNDRNNGECKRKTGFSAHHRLHQAHPPLHRLPASRANGAAGSRIPVFRRVLFGFPCFFPVFSLLSLISSFVSDFGLRASSF